MSGRLSWLYPPLESPMALCWMRSTVVKFQEPTGGQVSVVTGSLDDPGGAPAPASRTRRSGRRNNFNIARTSHAEQGASRTDRNEQGIPVRKSCFADRLLTEQNGPR